VKPESRTTITEEEMRILHLLRKPPGSLARDLMERQSREHELTMVLIPGAVATPADLTGRVLALVADGSGDHAPGDPGMLDYSELLEMIFDQDKAFCW
jgi:hypothetical protein